MDELMFLVSSPVLLTLLGLTALTVVIRLRLLLVATAILWGVGAIYAFANYYGLIMDDVRYLSIREGCIGPPDLFIALAIAICALMTYGALRPRT